MADDRAQHFASLAQIAREILRSRELRRQYFPAAMFSEIPWDMLLTLFCDEAAEKSHSPKSLCSTIAAPPTTARRWIDYLVAQELIVEMDHLIGSSVRLTAKARHALEQYLKAVSTSER